MGKYGITTSGLSDTDKLVVLEAAKISGEKLRSSSNYQNLVQELTGNGNIDPNLDTAEFAFWYYHGAIDITIGAGLGPTTDSDGDGKIDNCGVTGNQMACNSSTDVGGYLHEFGHVYDNAHKEAESIGHYTSDGFWDVILEGNFASDYLSSLSNGALLVKPDGFSCGDNRPCRRHPGDPGRKEMFADMYLNYMLAGEEDGYGLDEDMTKEMERIMGNFGWRQDGKG